MKNTPLRDRKFTTAIIELRRIINQHDVSLNREIAALKNEYTTLEEGCSGLCDKSIVPSAEALQLSINACTEHNDIINKSIEKITRLKEERFGLSKESSSKLLHNSQIISEILLSMVQDLKELFEKMNAEMSSQALHISTQGNVSPAEQRRHSLFAQKLYDSLPPVEITPGIVEDGASVGRQRYEHTQIEVNIIRSSASSNVADADVVHDDESVASESWCVLQ